MDHRVTEPSAASRGLVPEEGLEPSWPQGPRDFESRASTNSATPAIPRSHRRTGARKDSLPTARGRSPPDRVHDRKRAKSQIFGCGCFPPHNGGANRSAMHPTVLGKSLPTRRLRRCTPQFDAARLAPPAADKSLLPSVLDPEGDVTRAVIRTSHPAAGNGEVPKANPGKWTKSPNPKSASSQGLSECGIITGSRTKNAIREASLSIDAV